tara:strand:+ start:2369 stop:2575 length:207 start_codon:yes stop_codon:yes gene_type:complete
MRTTEQQSRGDNEEPDMDTMRYDLAEREAMNMSVSEIIELLINGCEGLDEAPDIEVKDEWNEIFGEEK